MMRNYDFTPLYRNFVGFDRMASLIDAASQSAASQNAYPPYNVVKLSDDQYQIELAVAGFTEDDFEIETRDNVLSVSARKAPADDASTDAPNADNDAGPVYLHRGIAERGFERRFQLADHVRVEAAALKHGLLTLSLLREIPEALKPRTIAINKSDEKLIGAKPSGKAKAA